MTARAKHPRVALVNMPFATTRSPSIQLGLLQAILARHRVRVTSHYFNLRFAARLGWEVFEIFCRQPPRLLGDWIFASAAFGGDAPDAGDYLDAFEAELQPFAARFGRGLSYLERLRATDAPSFVTECLDATHWDDYDVVGFTSTFAQTTAALALARRLKAKHPRLVTVFGGANFENEMGLEYLRAFSWIDHVVTGEGDEALPGLLGHLGSRQPLPPGVAGRAAGHLVYRGPAPRINDLDALPHPDYTDFFAAFSAVAVPDHVFRQPVMLPYESARGCWWGAKHHCSFCGLNGSRMAYRSKSPARVLEGFAHMAERYGMGNFVAVDNILDMRYVREVFGVLATGGREYSVFHEVKSNLTREQLELLARGGVTGIQPGIESLDTRLLTLMRKGSTAIQNVCLLKWAHHLGMTVLWNLLVGIPGERAEDHARQLAVLRMIPHLPPPLAGTIELHRFSPYFSDGAALGVQNIRPDAAYAHIYPAALDFARIAYYFEFDAPETQPREAHEPLHEHVLSWRRLWSGDTRPFLTYRRDADGVTITDGRQPDAPPVVHRFDALHAHVHECCGGSPLGRGRVAEALCAERFHVDATALQDALDRFTSMGLMLHEDGRYLSLALPQERQDTER